MSIGDKIFGFISCGQPGVWAEVVAAKAGLGILVRVEARPNYDHLPYGDQRRGLYVYTGDIDVAGAERRYSGVEDLVKWSFQPDGWRLDDQYVAAAIAAFLATPPQPSQAGRSTGAAACYYCGCTARGLSLGEPACEGCGG